jgi:ParB-like chromosome segregation protein Spo0J
MTNNIDVLSSCNSLRSLHDTAKKLVAKEQLSLAFEPKRANAFEMPVALIFADFDEAIRKQLDQEAIRSIADAYKAGGYVEPMSVKTEAGKMRVVTGFHRYAGLKLAIEEGAPIQRVWVSEVSGGRIEELRRQLVSDQVVALTAIERAEGYQALRDEHCSVEEIAVLVGRDKKHVRDMLALLNAGPEVVQMVRAGQASTSTAVAAIKECKSTGTDVVTHLKTELSKAQANGFNRITPTSTGKATALLPRKELEVAMPALLALADKLEEVLPVMGAPESVSLSLNLTGDLESLRAALLKIREVHKSAHPEDQAELALQA